VISATGLTKRFGRKTAVDDLTFEVHPGRVTGFLGPNGSGKSTTMRLMLGLDHANAGTATFDGKRYRQLHRPLTVVGALLDPGYIHPGRSARNHLRSVAASNGIPRRRVDDVLEMVGIGDVGKQLVGTFSLGMKQRLGLATALLGDPAHLVLDEPANGLDPEGIQWTRAFLSYLADQGRTVFVSSHLLGEMAMLADDLVVIGQGRLIARGTVTEFVQRYARQATVRVRSPQSEELAARLRADGATVREVAVAELPSSRAEPGGRLPPPSPGVVELVVEGADAVAIGNLAARHGLALHLLSPEQPSLEEAFLEVTRSSQEYRAGLPGHASPPPPPPPPPPPSPSAPEEGAA
jgi:ABC-2 type transport system ATP-binding protein